MTRDSCGSSRPSFSCRQISKPWPCGATRSISTRSGGCAAQALNTASADSTTETLCPSRVRRRFRNRELVSSSSAMRIDAGAFTIDLTMQDKGRGSVLVLVICQNSSSMEGRCDACVIYSGSCRSAHCRGCCGRPFDESDESNTRGRGYTERNSRCPRQGYPPGPVG